MFPSIILNDEDVCRENRPRLHRLLEEKLSLTSFKKVQEQVWINNMKIHQCPLRVQRLLFI